MRSHEGHHPRFRQGPADECGPTRRGDSYAESAVDISVVIPVYNSAKILPRLVDRLRAVLSGTGKTYELVMVDDASPDDSWRVLSDLRRQYPEHIVAVQLMRNYGQHNALMCAFRHARGNLIVTMDDDLQHPPEEIPKLIDAITSNDLDLVYGCYDKKKHPLLKNVGSRIVNAFFRKVFRLKTTVTAFRILRRELLEAILPYTLHFTFIDGLLAWNTRRIDEVTVAHHPRAEGRSGDSLGKMVTLALNLFTNFSLLPLQVVSLLGSFVAVCGLIAGFYYLCLHLMGSIVTPGYASIIVSVLTLGGIQLLGLGIIGEYLGRLHLNVNGKPQYRERHVLDGVAQDGSQPAALRFRRYADDDARDSAQAHRA